MPTPRKSSDTDAITLSEAASMLAMTDVTAARFRREGLLRRLDGYPSYSRADVQEFIDNPWLNGVQAAQVLGVSRARVSQLAAEEHIPVHRTTFRKRVYRMRQLEVVANARRARLGKSLAPVPPQLK
jgi:hypothetical protein